MPKAIGSSAKNKPTDFRHIIDEFTDGLVTPDERFQNFWTYQPVPKVMEWFKSKKKVKVIEGSNRSCKSFSGVYEAIMVYTGMIPPVMQGVYPYKIPTNRARLVRIIIQNYAKSWPETIRPILIGDPSKGIGGMLPKAWSNFDEQEHIFYGPDGSMLSIMAIDPKEDVDPNVLRGPAVDHTYVDEINTETVYTESLVRGAALRNGPRTLTLGYCPQEGLECWTYERLYASNFSKSTKKRLPEDKVSPDIHLIKLTMYDNPSISEEERKAIISVLRPWEIAYRVYGEYSSRATNPFFDMDSLLKWESEKKLTEGMAMRVEESNIDLETGKFIGSMVPDDDYGENSWRVWELPKEGCRYIMAADPAEGNVDGDYSVADLWECSDIAKPLQVSQLCTRKMKAGEFAVQCAMVATFYGKCLLAPEAKTVAGGIMVDRVRNYENLYKRITMGSEEEAQTERIGWDTNTGTKGPMLEDTYKALIKMANSGYCPIQSRNTLMELMSYEERVEKNNKTGLPKIVWGSSRGSHDDTVMAMAIAFRIMLHEYDKINICKFKKKSVDNYDTPWKNHILENKKREGVAFSGMKKKPSLSVLRKISHRGEYEKRERIRRSLR